MTHVQFVSKIGRTIGRALSLNEDLIEAIALGHDLGHVPFGHPGEHILNNISLKNNEGYFLHNAQSVRVLMNIENNGNGSNVSIQVLDGILCHNGEFVNQEYYPRKKSIDDFLNDYNSCYEINDYTYSLVPMTLEACVVRISDMIAYLGRDIEDAKRLKYENIIPDEIKNILGLTNSDIINNIISDIINNSINQPYIKLSDEVYKAIKDIKDLNYKNIYEKVHSKKDLEKMSMMFETVFNHYLKDLKTQNSKSDIYKEYLNYKGDNYRSHSDARIVIDFIAGMTDNYFIKKYKKISKNN